MMRKDAKKKQSGSIINMISCDLKNKLRTFEDIPCVMRILSFARHLSLFSPV